MANKKSPNADSAMPLDQLKSEAGNLVGALAGRALTSALGRINGSVGRLQEYAENGGGPGLKAALTGAEKLTEGNSGGRAALSAGASAVKDAAGGLLGKGGSNGGGSAGKSLKVTNIVETIDIGAPVRLVYDQWTQFADFPNFMKRVEKVEQESDKTVNWQAQIFMSHRNWEATIQEQIPDRRIMWTSEGQKGHVDGAVTFHELDPEMTRVLVVLEYWPQGFFEQTANIWRAQGRRVRLELKHFRRHVMTNAVLHPDEIEGWRGVIEDGEVVKDHETAIREEGDNGADQPDDEYDEYSEEDTDYAEGEADYEDSDDEDEDYDDEDEADEDDTEYAEPVRAGSRRTARR
ncbi:MAG: SRPBCC family protein [Streptosporangiaceae bacterium]